MQAFINRLTLIQGPPGTGKTETAAWLVDAFARQDKEIVLTSGQNIANRSFVMIFMIDSMDRLEASKVGIN